MEQLIKELGTIKQKIRRLEKRLQVQTEELIKLKIRRDELEKEIKPGLFGIGLTNEIKIIIWESSIPMTPKEILTKLEGNSHQFGNVKDPYSIVFAICARLAKHGIIGSVKKNERRAFTRK